MKDEDNISISDYEIGIQQNLDPLDLFEALKENNGFENKIIKYQHSLFYPILQYCIDILNSTINLETIKYKVGFYGRDYKIYVIVGRQMNDLFFTEQKGDIDNVEIEFNLGKTNFHLKSLKKDKVKDIEEYKTTYNLDDLKNKNDDFVKQIIQVKKKNIISKFLKGYSHQESILKTFESEIPGEYINLPNLIFKRANNEGKTIEEIDQIYSLNLNEKKKIIDGFDYFYYVKYLKGEEKEKISIFNGKKLELINNNLYFLEIKHSIKKLFSDYKKLHKISIESENKEKLSENSSSSLYKRDKLTSLGNSILTFSIFQKLIHTITKKEEDANLLYIVDSDFEENMIKIFEECLNRDKLIIKGLNLTFNLYLIYTQPDLALKHFIKEKWAKNNEIKLLNIENKKKNEEIEKKNEEIEKKNKELKRQTEELKEQQSRIEKQNQDIKIKFNMFEAEFLFINIDKQIIKFIEKNINHNKSIISIGTLETINDKHIYKFPSLKCLISLQLDSIKNFILVDLKTFNKAKLNDLENKNNCNIILENYKNNINNIINFNDIYILVDLLFLKNISDIISENIRNFKIIVYMFEKENFIIFLQKELIPVENIIFKKNECKNPLFEESETLNFYEVEQFSTNYYKLILLRGFFDENNNNQNNQDENKEFFLFGFKGRINYILELYKKSNNTDHNQNFYVEILPVKKEYNILLDRWIKDSVSSVKYKNIIYIRRTEFGNSFNIEELLSIIKYNFNIKNEIYCNNLISWEENFNNNKLHIQMFSYGENFLIRLIKNNHLLPIFLQKDKKINFHLIPLMEYLYFLFLPLLIKGNSKPKVLLLADDFGILNSYYKAIYKDKLELISYTQKEEYLKLPKEKVNIDNENIRILPFKDACNKLKAIKFDLIILEKFDEDDKKNNETIPNDTIFSNISKMLTDNGIFSLNLRSSSFYEKEFIMKKLKNNYKNIININLRVCSDFLIIFNNFNNIINFEKIANNSEIYENIIDLENADEYFKDFQNDLKSYISTD